MPANLEDSLIEWMEKFCGQRPEPHEYIKSIDGHPCFPPTGIGHSQLNELLLSLHLDRITEDFFYHVFRGMVVPTFEMLKECIREFRITAVLHYGNIKFAFKRLSQMTKEEIEREIGRPNSAQLRDSYTRRHDPLVAIRRIEARDTYYLGYLIDVELQAKKTALEATGESTAEIEGARASVYRPPKDRRI